MYSRLGKRIDDWFYPLSPLAWQVRPGSRYLAAVSRLAGRPLPLPRLCDVGEPERMARILAERQRHAPTLVVNTIVSSAVRSRSRPSARDSTSQAWCSSSKASR